MNVQSPAKEPEGQVDYIFVGMEPNFSWADSIEHAKEKVACGFMNYWGYERPLSKLLPNKPKHRLRLFVDSICRFLCQSGEIYYLTDLSKGAIPVAVADLDRERRYREWYPLLL